MAPLFDTPTWTHLELSQMDVVVSPSVVVNNYISVRAAAEFRGYSLQNIRTLLRCGKLVGLKIGQVWLIDLSTF